MACGLPVLAYDLDIFGSVYVKGFATVPIYEKDRFAAKLIGLLEDEQQRLAMGKEAVEQAKSLDWETVTTHFSNLLDLSVEKSYSKGFLKPEVAPELAVEFS
jgi:glycosyltransferase involved in cell wall biosynthesis